MKYTFRHDCDSYGEAIISIEQYIDFIKMIMEVDTLKKDIEILKIELQNKELTSLHPSSSYVNKHLDNKLNTIIDLLRS